MARNAGPKRLANTAAKALVFGLLLLPALLPLLQGNALPCTHDNIFHSYRIVAMRDMLRHGWLFSRWVPNLALGYGYPFFNYREPLPYLAGEALYALGLPLPLVLGLLYAVSLIAAAWGAYVLARDLFGEAAGWVAGVAYGLSPYLLMDTLRRGNMPESVGLALLPWVFVTIRRLILRRSRVGLVITTMLLVALFLSHNISSLLLAPFLGAYVVLLAWVHRDRGGWPYAFVAVGLAVLLTAWFWLPALAEQDFVQLHLSRTTRNNDYHFNFVTWQEMLLTPPTSYDPSYLNPPMRIMVGVGHVALGAVGLVLGLLGRRSQRVLVALLGIAATTYLWMASPGAVGIWEQLDLLSFVQFPWRLVGRAILPICLLAGFAVEAGLARLGGTNRSVTSWARPAAVCGVVAVFVVLAWPDTYPPKGMCPSATYPEMEELYAQESDGWLGMDPESSYFPVWVAEHPQGQSLAAAFAEGVLPERFDTSAMPDEGVLMASEYRPLRARLRVSAPTGYTARWLGLYFPGWSVRIDGVAVVVSPEAQTGLMTFDVPAGEHQIDVRFAGTPARRLGAALAGVGIAASLSLSLTLPGRRRPQSRRTRTDEGGAGHSDASVRGSPATTVALLGLAVAMVGLRYTVVDRVETLVRRDRLDGRTLPEVVTPLGVDYAGGLRLLGFTQRATSLVADGEFVLDLLWQARASMDQDYRMTVLFRGADGQIWSPAGTLRPRGYEPPVTTRGWIPGQYAHDPHVVTLLPGVPPGDYDVIVSVFDADTLDPDSVLPTERFPAGPDLVLGTIRVTAPRVIPSLEALEVPKDSPTALCGPYGLWSMTVDRSASVPGGIVAIRWVWEALGMPDADTEATLALISPDRDALDSWSLPLSAAWWPTGQWTAGERWTGRHVVRLPGDLSTGEYRLVVSLPGCEPLAEVTLAVEAPVRLWAVPAEFVPASVIFAYGANTGGGELIELAGAILPDPVATAGQRLDVALAWRGLAPMNVSYRVFLHLLDAHGNLIDQDDGEPAAWARPTPGWAVGEVVTESRHVALPDGAAAGQYVLRLGVYEVGGARLTTAEGDDGTVLAIVAVR